MRQDTKIGLSVCLVLVVLSIFVLAKGAEVKEKTETTNAQIILKKDGETFVLVEGPWAAVEPIVGQVALVLDAYQWRELRARLSNSKEQSDVGSDFTSPNDVRATSTTGSRRSGALRKASRSGEDIQQGSADDFGNALLGRAIGSPDTRND